MDVGDVPTLDGLTFETRGDRVLVVAAARALFQAAAGLRGVAHGSLLVEGTTPFSAVRGGLAACAPLDPPLPPRWTLAEYVGWSARLAGHSRSAATALAADAMGRMGLVPLARTRLRSAARTARRATVVAAALAAAPRTLLLEDPLAALSTEEGHALATTLAEALQDRRWAIFAAPMPRESPLVGAATEAVVLDGSHVAGQGAPGALAPAPESYALRVAGDVTAFVAAVEAEGARIVEPPQAERPARLSVNLGSLRTRDLLRIALASSAVVVELRPLPAAFR